MLVFRSLTLFAVMAAGVFRCMSSAEAAMLVHDGTLVNVVDVTGAPVGTSIDVVAFSVTTAGTVSLDVRSFELDDVTGSPVDLNGDSEFAFIDSYLLLFHDDGGLDVSDFIAFSDDDPDPAGPLGFSDGSVSIADSFLSEVLAAGNYLVAVAAEPFFDVTDPAGLADAVAAMIAGFDGTPDKPIVLDPSGRPRGNDHGDYRLTISGNVAAVVPEPASCVLWGSFGLCICLPRLVRRIRRPAMEESVSSAAEPGTLMGRASQTRTP